MDSGENSLHEPNYNLRSDPPAGSDDGRIRRYISIMRKNYTEIQRMFSLSYAFIGYLYQENCLTFEQMNEMRVYKKLPNGEADALILIQKVLHQLGDKAADPFLKALVHPECRQDALAMFIDPERARELIKERDNPSAGSASGSD